MSNELVTQRPRLIGLTGKMGSGKDTVLLRLQALFGDHVYKKMSYAEPLKESAAKLLNITVEQLEAMKNEPQIRLCIADLKGAGRDLGRSFSIREYLQRYGTEAHRDVFGEDFWVAAAMASLDRKVQQDARLRVGPHTYVFTDVRFDNEAKAIVNAGGRVYRVVGNDPDTGDHPSEAGVDEKLVWGTIDNSTRPTAAEVHEDPESIPTAIALLDDEVARLHAEWTA